MDIEEAGSERKCEGWFEWGRCTLPIKVDYLCWCDCYSLVEVNLVTLTCWEYYWILNISLTICHLFCCLTNIRFRILAHSFILHLLF